MLTLKEGIGWKLKNQEHIKRKKKRKIEERKKLERGDPLKESKLLG